MALVFPSYLDLPTMQSVVAVGHIDRQDFPGNLLMANPEDPIRHKNLCTK